MNLRYCGRLSKSKSKTQT